MEINKREINDDKNKLELEQYSESFFTKIKIVVLSYVYRSN